jgi:hypothetical protein
VDPVVVNISGKAPDVVKLPAVVKFPARVIVLDPLLIPVPP